MTKEKFKEILNIVYKDKSSRSQLMNLKIRPRWDKLRKFKALGIPADAFFDINKWLEEEEAQEQGKKTDTSSKASA